MRLHNFSLNFRFLLVSDFDLFDQLGLKKKPGDLTKLSTSPNRALSNELNGKVSESFVCFRCPSNVSFPTLKAEIQI